MVLQFINKSNCKYQQTCMTQQFQLLIFHQTSKIKNTTHTPFIIHMINVTCPNYGDQKCFLWLWKFSIKKIKNTSTHLPDPTISTFGLLSNQQNKKHNSCTFIIHMTKVNCLKIWDPKMLFLVAELINKMIEQYQTTGVKYHFHPVSLISIKHLIHQHTTASKHCNPKQSMI